MRSATDVRADAKNEGVAKTTTTISSGMNLGLATVQFRRKTNARSGYSRLEKIVSLAQLP